MKVLTIVLLLSLPLLGKTLTLVDDSPSDSPMTWRGTVTYDSQGQANCALIAHNNTSRMIVAYRIQFDIVRQDGRVITMKHRDDRFFKPQGWLIETSPQPKLDWQMPDSCGDWLSVAEGSSNTPSSVHIKAIFVQLDDGTLWGADDIVQEIMHQRVIAIEYLKSLAAAYESGGASALTEALKQAPEGPNPRAGHVPYLALGKFAWLRQLPDATSQVESINADLALAEARSAWLK